MSVILASVLSLAWPSTEPPVPERWRAWPVSRVFPDVLPGTSPSGARVTYVLAGIAPEARCRDALQPAAASALPGCLTALRATYADSTETFVVTAGIAVLGSPPGRSSARPLHGADRPASVRPVAFPGGPAERFGERQYVTGFLASADDRYVVLTSAGYADGRPYQKGGTTSPRLSGVARDVASALHAELTR